MAHRKDNEVSSNDIIDKDKLVSELKESVINELEDYLINIVEDNSKNKLESMERKIYKYKNKTIRKKNIIIFFLILIIVLENYYLYDEKVFSNYLFNNHSEVINNNTKEDTVKDLNYYINEYGYLIDMVNTKLDNDNFNYLYRDSYKVSEIDKEIKLNISYMNISDSNINSVNGVKTVSEDIVKSSYNKIFNDNKYEVGNFKYSCLNFIYNKNNLSYMAIDTGCDDNKEIIKSIIDIKEKDNYIEIITLVGILKDNTLYDIENNLIESNYHNQDLSNFNDSLTKYKYTFIKDKGNYYFDSIEKIL